MLFIPMSISGVSGTLSAVSASANEYHLLIAQEDRATFTAQTLQTDGKTLTVSYANAAAVTPLRTRVEVLADGVNFTDYSYDAATGVLKNDGAKVTDASYIGTDYTEKPADSKYGTSTLPEYIAVLIDGDMLDEEFFSYDKKTGDITINGAVITGDTAFEMYKLAVLDEQGTEHCTSGTVTAEGCTGSWSFDADNLYA